MHTIEVRNPVAQQRGVIDSLKINERPGSLDGLTVGLLWSGTARQVLSVVPGDLHIRAMDVSSPKSDLSLRSASVQ